MAVTQYGDIVKLGTQGDAFTLTDNPTFRIQAITLEHSAAAAATIQVGGVAAFNLRVTTSNEVAHVVFPAGLSVSGVTASAKTASSNLYVYLA